MKKTKLLPFKIFGIFIVILALATTLISEGKAKMIERNEKNKLRNILQSINTNVNDLIKLQDTYVTEWENYKPTHCTYQ